MENKKNNRIIEIVLILVVTICLGLIVMELSNNVSNKISEIRDHSGIID